LAVAAVQAAELALAAVPAGTDAPLQEKALAVVRQQNHR
jgi:hypothetical protein